MPQSAGLHEDAKVLRPETIDRHRAFASLGEELEAIDWYDQRVDAAGDEALRTYLFAEGSIVGREAAVEAGGSEASSVGDSSLGIGSLKR